MSRTINTQPYDWQKQNREWWHRHVGGYPSPYGGAWPSRKWYTRIRNRQERHHQNQQLRQGVEELKPWRFHSVDYDIW